MCLIIGMYLTVLTSIGKHLYVLYILVCIGMYLYLLISCIGCMVCISMYGMYWSVFV